MKSILLITLISAFIYNIANSQNKIPEEYFAPEANSIATEKGLLISIKKYNPTQEEIGDLQKKSPGNPYSPINMPTEITRFTLYNRALESMLYYLDQQGEMVWQRSLGYSDRSQPSPVKKHHNYIYTGEADKEKDKIRIQKIDLQGKTIWQTEMDSLVNVNDIYVNDKTVSALVSFNVLKQKEANDRTFYHDVYPIYFFVQLDINTGAVIKKEYQQMGNYLSSLKLDNPVLNTDYSYILSNKDSAAFLQVVKQKNATILTRDMDKRNKIIHLTADTASYHFLTILSKNNNVQEYYLMNDFYGKQKKNQSLIPLTPGKHDRSFLYKLPTDSLLTVISQPNSISIFFTDIDGKSTLSRKTEKLFPVTVAAGIFADKVYTVHVSGREKTGSKGKLVIHYH